jgi:hypothetical protein
MGPVAVILGSNDGVIIGSAYRESGADTSSGELLWFSGGGELKRTFSFARQVTLGEVLYRGPWTIRDYRVHEEAGHRRIAVVAHDYRWWPSLVTILNERWEQAGTFVNAGWITHLQWVSSDRLVVSGFSNPHDGGMVALLDANAMDGQSPPVTDPKYTCASCGAGRPLRYIVMPRSEVNEVTSSPWNEARLYRHGDGVIVRTMEMPSGTGAPEVLYEFSRDLELVRASFSDRYWEAHRALELAGRIAHSRENCPDRDGPRTIHVWEPATGWRMVKIR